jgi:hypothetical protein
VVVWNKWRVKNPDVSIDLRETILSRADLRGADLSMADLRGTNLSRANLSEATIIESLLNEADLSNADLGGARLVDADLSKADLHGAKLGNVDLSGADLSMADLGGANLIDADLSRVNLSEANLEGAILVGCNIYAISAWGLELDGAEQNDLIITPPNESVITVDNLEVAQFIYLLLHNEKIRDVIDTVAKKVVLILGRFTDTRKPVLIAIKDKLRDLGYLPVLFDFDPPAERNTLETVTLLARLSRFIIADLTEPRSVPQELISIVPVLPSVPVKPIIQEGHEPWGMYDAIRCYPWVLERYYYSDVDSLMNSLEANVIGPVIAKANESRSID